MKVGLDTLNLVFRVGGADLSALDGAQTVSIHTHGRHESDEAHSSQTWGRLPSGLHARTQGSHGEGLRVIVAGSLAAAGFGHNAKPASVEVAHEVVRDVVVPELRDCTEDLDESWVGVSRCDTVTDLRCDEAEMGPVLRAFETVPIRAGITRELLRSSSERPETLWARNGGGGVRLYDNLRDKARKGVDRDTLSVFPSALRAEGQSGRDWLKAQRMRDLQQVNKENVVQLHSRRIAWAGLDREVVTLETWVERLAGHCASSGISDRVRRGVMAYLLEVAVGLPGAGSKQALARYRKIAREAGVHPSEVLPASREVVYRLDFERGRVVKEAA